MTCFCFAKLFAFCQCSIMPDTLTSPPLSPRATERGAQELINEYLKRFFTGESHISHLGDVTFPKCDLLFNQAKLPDPPAENGKRLPQIHTVIRIMRKHETWFTNGDLSQWDAEVANPASGVSYGRVENARIEESVHGKLARILTGTDIRWQADGGDFVEQVWIDTAWETIRTFAGASALRWKRINGDYLEQVLIGSDWQTVRTISTASAIWDGAKILVEATAEFSFYVRVVAEGDDDAQSDFLCRGVADNLKELFESDSRFLLGAKGIRHPHIRSGPSAIAK